MKLPSFIRPNTVEVDCEFPTGTRTLLFAPISLDKLYVMKDLLSSAARIASVFMRGPGDDLKHTKREVSDEGLTSSENIWEPPTTDTVKFRAQEREQAIESLIESFLEPRRMTAICDVILSCLREEEEFKGLDPAEFAKECPITVIPELLRGVIEANRRVSGPLGRKIEEALERLRKQAGGRLDQVLRTENPEEAEATES